MKQFFFALMATTVFTVFANNANAKLFRVNNNAGIKTDALFVFNNVTDAITAASAGDTLYLEPSTISYGEIVLSKKITLLGPGYLLDKNTGREANQNSAIVDDIIVNSGDGTVIQGLTINGSKNTNNPSAQIGIGLSINADNMVISNNYFTDNCSSSCISFWLSNSHSNIVISQNYIARNISSVGVSQISNLIINNNIFPTENSVVELTNTSCYFLNNAYGGALLHLDGDVKIENNILVNANLNIINNNPNHLMSAMKSNVFAAFFTGNNRIDYNIVSNIQGINFMTGDRLVGSTSPSLDGYWQFGVGANGWNNLGTDGNNVGPFGGTAPYILSGLPPIPHISTLTIGTISSNTLPITISASSYR